MRIPGALIIFTLQTVCLLDASRCGAAVFWANDPIGPGETLMLMGEELGNNTTVELARLNDEPPTQPADTESPWPSSAIAVNPKSASGQSLMTAIPADWSNGVYGYRITSGGSRTQGLVNQPQLWWAQGNLGTNASPGTWLRLFGKNMGWPAGTVSAGSMVFLDGPVRRTLPAVSDVYSAQVSLPSDLPAGVYDVQIHNGLGGNSAWSSAIAVSISKPVVWNQSQVNVMSFGAQGNGFADDTDAIQNAIATAGSSGGGIVLFPRGKYFVSNTLNVPRGTVLRGASQQTVCLAWPEYSNPPFALVQGSNSFGLEDITIYAANHRHVIVGDFGDKANAGNIFLHRVRIRASAYRGRLTTNEIDQRFRASAMLGSDAADLVRFGGANVEITDCDLYGSGNCMRLIGVAGARVSGNRLFNGRWGGYRISGSDGLVFENNIVRGADLMSAGGSIGADDATTFSRNVFFSSNSLSMFNGLDRAALTAGSPAMAYWGQISAVNGNLMALANSPNWSGLPNWKGSGVAILRGRGAGQFRRLQAYSGSDSTVQIDSPWSVNPDGGSVVLISTMQTRYAVVGNTFSDCGMIGFQSANAESIFAGNSSSRTKGFIASGLVQNNALAPTWFCQIRENTIFEGAYYNLNVAAPPGIFLNAGSQYPGSLNFGVDIRRNVLAANAQLQVNGPCRDVLLEKNQMGSYPDGVRIDSVATNTLAIGNSGILK